MADSVTEQQVLDALRQIKDPDLHRDVVSLGMIKDLQVSDGRVSFTFELTTPACPVRAQFESAAHKLVSSLPGVASVDFKMTSNVRPGAGPQRATLPGVKHIIAIGSGKGGVGKSTVSVNLAAALTRSGCKVGLLDADVYGATVPGMLRLGERPTVAPDGVRLLPLRAHGMEVMSMGVLVEDRRDAVVWRGPMVGKAVTQMLTDVAWGELDYLLIDLPPGTGDASLSIAQAVPLSGVAVVCTPQRVALEIAMKAVAMFKTLRVPILGLIENMSYYRCSDCGAVHHPFSEGGVAVASRDLKVPVLGQLPLSDDIREGADEGVPAALGEGEQAEAFASVAKQLAAQVSIHAYRTLPVLSVR